MSAEIEIVFPLTVAKVASISGVTKQAVYKLLKKHKVKPELLVTNRRVALLVQMHFNVGLQIQVAKHYVEMVEKFESLNFNF